MTEPALRELADAGLVLQAVLDLEVLPPDLRSACAEAGVDVDRHQRLVLLGQGGGALWEFIRSRGVPGPNAFDDTAARLVTEWVEVHHPAAAWELVYPSDLSIPLGRLGTHAGWGAPSPLGLSIHPVWGLWQAHRAAFVIDAPIPVTDRTPPLHACDSCVDQPCVAACPVGAVSVDAPFDVETCGRHRIGEGSECAHRCLARNACPVGTDHRYGEAQMTHHYAASLPTLHRWLGG